METRVLVIKYANRLSGAAIPLFRGAVIGSMDGNADILFHNHDGESLAYHYPLIQYKRIEQCASIVAIDEGADIIGQFLSSGKSNLTLGKRTETFTISEVYTTNCEVLVNDEDYEYNLYHWLPFNSENYAAFNALGSLSEKVLFLERILVGNILSFAKGVNVSLDSNIICWIQDISRQQLLKYKGVKMMAFDLTFRVNVALPDFIGLGKGVSLGFGTINKITD